MKEKGHDSNWVLNDKQTHDQFFRKRNKEPQSRCHTVGPSPINLPKGVGTIHERLSLRTNLLRKDQDPQIIHSMAAR